MFIATRSQTTAKLRQERHVDEHVSCNLSG